MLKRYGKDENGKVVEKAVVYTRDEHQIDRKQIDPDAIFVVKKLCEAGYHSYIVGGAVRDLLCAKTPKDFDIVTTATPNRINRIFHNSRIIGKRFRIVHVVIGNKIFEVTTFRSIEKGCTVGNEFGSIEQDVHRRDFTLNALYYDVLQDQVIDYVGGVRDIKKQILRNVIPLDRIFAEDPVRMIRALRYSVKTDSKIPFAIWHKIKQAAPLLQEVSRSRLSEEFSKIIMSGGASQIILQSMEVGIFGLLQPHAADLIAFDKDFASDYTHSLQLLDENIEKFPEARVGSRIVFLIQDYAKIAIKELTKGGNTIDGALAKMYEIKVGPQATHHHRRSRYAYSSTYNRLYSYVWDRCRMFLSPISFQRAELDFAVRTILLKIPLKKTRKVA